MTDEPKFHEWTWNGDGVLACWGHDSDEELIAHARKEIGLRDDDPIEIAHRWVCRDPDNDGKGDADEAWRSCEPMDEGARAISMERT